MARGLGGLGKYETEKTKGEEGWRIGFAVEEVGYCLLDIHYGYIGDMYSWRLWRFCGDSWDKKGFCLEDYR